ncbi:hypothetical protein [Nocardioides sp.]|uniref:hypothetical protein n=1 Tax=Nocardioides sp. TaxID=35761 RepID=UPI002B84CB8B|nr:hypothetical protein [Nocardioides sp.]HXH79546.1 hypothetical protein [Nocardioides sp.]
MTTEQCEACRGYSTAGDLVGIESDDRWFDIFTFCAPCREAMAAAPPMWNLSLWGLGDNDSGWLYWERAVPNADFELHKLLGRTEDADILEEHRSDWLIEVRWNGYLRGTGRPRKGEIKTYDAWAVRVPPALAHPPEVPA